MEVMDDLHYYNEFISGNDEALAFLVEKYNKNMVLFLTSYTRSVERAEDAVADTFLKLFIKKPKFNGASSFKTWLFKIAINTARTNYAKDAGFEKRVSSYYDNMDLENENDLVEFILDDSQKETIRKALENIHPDYGTALKLKYFEDFSIDEICGIMHKTKKQVNNLLYRGKVDLKQELKKAGFKV